ncbi:hypothetical protein MUK42_11997 [Musa troglodytarum]|uniref:Uncharacterized protein n=1 Tax=Musa troglodytarum TaxID=320322 RepID=A0A9E7GI24_9LILI|nr:hypothetical protein MUK42_11997 [Musa troglodytarum]
MLRRCIWELSRRRAVTRMPRPVSPGLWPLKAWCITCNSFLEDSVDNEKEQQKSLAESYSSVDEGSLETCKERVNNDAEAVFSTNRKEIYEKELKDATARALELNKEKVKVALGIKSLQEIAENNLREKLQCKDSLRHFNLVPADGGRIMAHLVVHIATLMEIKEQSGKGIESTVSKVTTEFAGRCQPCRSSRCLGRRGSWVTQARNRMESITTKYAEA